MSEPRGFRLCQDDDCHWYLIPDGEVVAFECWVAAGPYWDDYHGPVFDDNRIDCPHRVLIMEYLIDE